MRRSAFALVVLVSGCMSQKAGRAPPSAPPSAAEPPGSAAPQDATTSTGGVTKQEGTTPPSTPAPPPVTPGTSPPIVKPGYGGTPGTVAQAQLSFDQSNQSFAAAGSDCISMCKALTSMTNATEHLCELTKAGGESDQKRCTEAKAKLAGAQAKVKASCGGCGS